MKEENESEKGKGDGKKWNLKQNQEKRQFNRQKIAALALLAGLVKNNRSEQDNYHFQKFDKKTNISWEIRVRTWLQTVRHREITDDEWRSFLAQYRTDFNSFATSQTVFSTDALVRVRSWLEAIGGTKINDEEFTTCITDFYRSHNINYNDSDVQRLTLIRTEGITANTQTIIKNEQYAERPPAPTVHVTLNVNHIDGNQGLAAAQTQQVATTTTETTTTTEEVETSASSNASSSEQIYKETAVATASSA